MFNALRSEQSFGRPDALPGPWELAWEAEHLEGASPQRVLEWAVETYGDRLALSASFGGPEGMALIDMVSRITDEVTVLTIDTGFLFKETTEFREEFMRRYKLPLEVLRPKLTIEEQLERYGERMRTCNPDLCCQVRKIEPLERAPVNPLLWQGYKSIGCEPQTRPVAADEDARAGRWSGLEKTECGLHWVDGKVVRGDA